MTEGLLALLGGLAIGLVVIWLLTQQLAQREASAEFGQWKVRELYGIRRDALAGSRPDIQRRVGQVIATWSHGFPFFQEDSRFIGHPIDYVVFEGYSELKAKRESQITCVTFVRAREAGRDDPDATLVEDCVRGGRVEWRTLVIEQSRVSKSVAAT